MKNFIFGFISALILAILLYFGYTVTKGFFAGGGGPVLPSELMSGATSFGNLKVVVSSAVQPVVNLEVDLGQPGGRMSYLLTDSNGIAYFFNVPVGTFNVFFNDLNYPKEYERVSSVIAVEIVKNQTTVKEIELKAK